MRNIRKLILLKSLILNEFGIIAERQGVHLPKLILNDYQINCHDGKYLVFDEDSNLMIESSESSDIIEYLKTKIS